MTEDDTVTMREVKARVGNLVGELGRAGYLSLDAVAVALRRAFGDEIAAYFMDRDLSKFPWGRR